MNFWATLFYEYRRFWKALTLFFVLAGPGIIVMIADNDAGGITTYLVTGAQYKYYFLWFLILLGPIAYFVQEMTVRLGAVTKHGHAEAIFSSFGPFWGWFSLLDLVFLNWLTIITEFIGMTAAMSIFHIPAPITILIVCIIMIAMVMQGNYWSWEKLALVFCLINLIYIPAAFFIHPSVKDILYHCVIPRLPPGGFNNQLFFMLMANIGTTIAPWMIFFQQSSVVDKNIREKHIVWGQTDTAMGALFTVLVAVFCVIVTGTVLYGVNVTDAAQAAIKMMSVSKYLGTFIAIGLFDAGFLGAICISLASSWAFGEVFGWAHSLNSKIKEAPWFYAFYALALLTAGAVVLIPKAPLVLITLFVQVVAVTLLPAALIFLIILLNNDEIMGKYKNTLTLNIINISIVSMIIILSTMYGISTLFPNMFK